MTEQASNEMVEQVAEIIDDDHHTEANQGRDGCWYPCRSTAERIFSQVIAPAMELVVIEMRREIDTGELVSPERMACRPDCDCGDHTGPRGWSCDCHISREELISERDRAHDEIDRLLQAGMAREEEAPVTDDLLSKRLAALREAGFMPPFGAYARDHPTVESLKAADAAADQANRNALRTVWG